MPEIKISDPAWIGVIIGVVALIVSIVIAVVTILVQRRRKAVSYEILALTPLVDAKRFDATGLQVTFNSQPIATPTLALVRLFNSGNVPISADEYEKGLYIAFPEHTRILTADILETSPNDLDVKLSINGMRVSMEPCLLNPSDSMTIRAILAGSADQAKVGGRIKGVNEIRQKKDGAPRNRAILFFMMGIALIILTVYVVGGSLSAFSPPIIFGIVLMFLIGAAMFWEVRN